MAVGVSYILGIRTPDNFNKPFISADIKEFWDRWHITCPTGSGTLFFQIHDGLNKRQVVQEQAHWGNCRVYDKYDP